MTSKVTLIQTFQPLTPLLKLRPFIKWAGGKRKLIPNYQPYFPKVFRHYYEPFLGGGAVLFNLLERNSLMKATVMDINSDLVNCYNVIKDKVEDLIELLIYHKQTHNLDYFYKIRGLDRDPDFIYKFSDVERAARLIYLNKTCFNGLYRVNTKGFFNVPFGRYTDPKICDVVNLQNVSTALKNVEILNQSFEKILDYAKRGDFIYFDPPYQPISSTANFTSYTDSCFDERHQKKLFEVFKKLDNEGCFTIISNSYSEFIFDLYDYLPNSCFKIIHASRAINSNGQKRGKIPEILILGRTLLEYKD